MSNQTATELYQDGDYLATHDDWHLSDSEGKASEVLPHLRACLEHLSSPEEPTLIDIGAGVGGVLDSLRLSLGGNGRFIADEFASAPREKGTELFPLLEFRSEPVHKLEAAADVGLLIDVLEHLENPWELLRQCHETCQTLVLRQPLLAGFSTFRHNNYAHQRNHWGHIHYYDARSLVDMMHATGWEPLSGGSVPPWKLEVGTSGDSLPNRLIHKSNPTFASFFLSGYYWVGSFKKTSREPIDR